jgi:hypothetical protein
LLGPKVRARYVDICRFALGVLAGGCDVLPDRKHVRVVAVESRVVRSMTRSGNGD